MKIRAILIFLIIFQSSFAQTWQDTLSIIDNAFSQYHPKKPGCQLSVSRNGQIIFSKAWGMADLEHKVALSTNSIFEAGSVSKQFTAASILLLEQQGKLSLDDEVRKYIPELPNYGTPIKLRQMLHHTSGLREWSDLVALTGWPRGTRFYTPEDILEMLVRQKHLNFKPGDEFLYSNSNYILFAVIIQRVSGMDLASFTQQYIFEPAGMTHTQWRSDPNRIVPNRAIAYSKSDSVFVTDMPNEYVYGPGGLLTTTEDLIKWSDFYQQGKLGTSSLLAKQILTEPLNDGEINTYAAGLSVRQVNGWKNISHNGATAGYRAYLETFPELNLSFAILSNTSQFNINSIAGKLRNIFVSDRSEHASKKESGINLTSEKLNAFVGLYKNERDGSTFELSIKNNEVILDNNLALVTIAENIVKSDNFQLNINGRTGWYIPYSPRDTILFTKVTPAKLQTMDFHFYEGKYFSEEINSTVTIQHNKDTLIIHFRPTADYPLIPTYTDAFKTDDLGNVEFIRNSQKKIFGIKINLSRTRNVEFKKIK